MQHFLYSEAGRGHQNEDAIEVRTHPQNPDALLCALADGQGGQRGGAAASQIAVRQCLGLASAYSAEQLLEPSRWYKILSRVDDAVCEDADAGYTTLVGAIVMDGRICGASCGDSEAWLVASAEHLFLTERQHKNPSVGSGAAYPTAFSARFGAGARLLIMSDGVWKYTSPDLIVESARKKEAAELVRSLRDSQLRQSTGGLPDDFSIIVAY